MNGLLDWLDYFRTRGYRDVEPLAGGVEGSIFRLGDGTVAKLWDRRTIAELERLQQFYEDVGAAGLPFQTPRLLQLEEVDGHPLSIDVELAGTPLQGRLAAGDAHIDEVAVEALVTVLGALRTVTGTEAMKQLPVLDEHRPLWSEGDTFVTALSGLLHRRVAQAGTVLRKQVDDFDRKHRAIIEGLEALPALVAPTLVHGDLFGENILVDDAGRVTAVLDFGLFSTAGDPRMDAAVTAAIVNMYGPHARTITTELTDRIADALHYPTEVLVLYRAAYALASSTFLSPLGTDGHFAWCVGWLNAPEVTAVLGG